MEKTITLEALSLDHVPLMVEGALESIAEVNPWMDWCSESFTHESARDFIAKQTVAKQAGTAYEFALFNGDGLYLGGGGVNTINQLHQSANIGYWIRTSQTQKGYGTAALHALVSWARTHTELNRLEVVVATGNKASQRVAEKGGATYEGIAKARLFNNGQFLDAKVYAFTQ